MRPPSRYIRPLPSEEIALLNEVMRNSPSHRTRQRAHAILLSSKRYAVNDLSDIFEVTRDTIVGWLEKFENSGVSGLGDEDRSGRPRKLDKAKLDNLVRAIEEHPQAPLKGQSVEVSKSTINRALKRLGYSWKRLRLSLSGQRDEQEFRRAQTDLNQAIAAAKRGLCDVFF